MKKVKYLINVAKRYFRLQTYKRNLKRRICVSMIDFQHAPIADINALTGRLVRDNGTKLY